MLREKVKNYLDYSGITKVLFCKRIGITTQWLYLWLRGEKEFSAQLEAKVDEYLNKYYIVK